jgi:hypothetical protein
MKSTLTWDVMPCCLVNRYQQLKRNLFPPSRGGKRPIYQTTWHHIPGDCALLNVVPLSVSVPEHRGQHFPGFLTGFLQETEHTFCVHVLWPRLHRQRVHVSSCHSSPSWYMEFPAAHVLGGEWSAISPPTVVRNIPHALHKVWVRANTQAQQTHY